MTSAPSQTRHSCPRFCIIMPFDLSVHSFLSFFHQNQVIAQSSTCGHELEGTQCQDSAHPIQRLAVWMSGAGQYALGPGGSGQAGQGSFGQHQAPHGDGHGVLVSRWPTGRGGRCHHDAEGVQEKQHWRCHRWGESSRLLKHAMNKLSVSEHYFCPKSRAQKRKETIFMYINR